MFKVKTFIKILSVYDYLCICFYMYRLLAPLQPGAKLPDFSGRVLHRGRESDININQLKGMLLTIILIVKKYESRIQNLYAEH